MPLSATVGSASIPVYINGGLPTVCTSINLNAASATKLLNSRSLWGQTFNGEKNISGNMTGVGSLTATGDITTTTNMKANGDIVADSTG